MIDTLVQVLHDFSENAHVQEQLEPGYLIDELRSNGVISNDEHDSIIAKNSRLARQRQLLLEILPKCDDAAFQQLLAAMEHEKYRWAHKILQRMVEKKTKS